jgi:hypothetical protein
MTDVEDPALLDLAPSLRDDAEPLRAVRRAPAKEGVVHAIERAADRRLLSIEEVVAARRPATLCAFGDHLLFLDGTVYALPHSPEPSDLAEPLHLPGAYVITHTVGIEFGWQHLDDCPCPLCAGAPQKKVA